MTSSGKRAPGNKEYEFCRDKCEAEKLIRVRQISRDYTKPETRIYPNEQAIYAKIQEMINAHLSYGDKKLVEMDHDESRNAHKTLVESIKVLDMVICVKNPIVDNKLSPRGPNTIVS